jgi:hypothetical protein
MMDILNGLTWVGVDDLGRGRDLEDLVDLGRGGAVEGGAGLVKPGEEGRVIIRFDGVVGSNIRQIVTPLAQLGQ